MAGDRRRIAVIGAGAVGLSTALKISKDHPSAAVHVFADKFVEETLSFGAGGFFWPDDDIGPTREITRQWFRDSFNYYVSLMNSAEAVNAGIQRISGYTLSSIGSSHLTNTVMEELFPDLRKTTEKEMDQFPSEYKYGVFFTTIIADPRRYLKWLMDRGRAAGVQYTRRTIHTFAELQEYHLVVNCCGLGAKELTDDIRLKPVRGQVLKVRAPWVKHFYCADGYQIVPGTEFVTVGGTKQLGNYKTEVSPYDKRHIWEKCTELLPSLKKAEFGFDWVGLRPYRQPVRVEKELIQFDDTSVQVIHNYGHGSHGINLSWGTAKQVSAMAQNILFEI